MNDGDFEGLSGIEVTFYLPWVNYTSLEDIYMDIDNISIELEIAGSNSGGRRFRRFR
tara:strand:- start:492 stop:662 length:171 start_codon:yes stop_codon:yes gene_type:complete